VLRQWLGSIGSVVSIAVAALGFNVIGWARSDKGTTYFRVFVGADAMDEYFKQSN